MVSVDSLGNHVPPVGMIVDRRRRFSFSSIGKSAPPDIMRVEQQVEHGPVSGGTFIYASH